MKTLHRSPGARRVLRRAGRRAAAADRDAPGGRARSRAAPSSPTRWSSVTGDRAGDRGRRGAGDELRRPGCRDRDRRAARPLHGRGRRSPGSRAGRCTDVRVRAGDNRREVTLPIEKVAESVAVGRDPATAASDPKSERFSNVLSKDQIEALPDDPDEMEKVLKDMAGPGATHPRRRLPRRQAAAEVADPLDPLLERDVRRREPQRRAHLRRHLDAARARPDARQHGLLVPRRVAQRAQCVPVGEGAGTDAAVQPEPERHAAQGPDLVLALRGRRLALRLGLHLRGGAGPGRWRRRSGVRPTG